MSYFKRHPSRPLGWIGLREALFVTCMIACLAAGPSVAKTLTIGTISASPVEEIETFQPFADFLAGKLAADGIDTVKVVIASDVADITQKLKDGEIDLSIDSSVTALVINELTGSTFLVRRWKKQRPKYRSVIFVSKDSPIERISDLKGKKIAFEEPFSTSGFMLPALTMRLDGLKLKRLTSVRGKPGQDEVGDIMAFDNETQVAWVERGLVHAAAMSEGDLKDFTRTALKPFRSILFTPYVPYHVVSVRPGLDLELAKRIATVLKKLHETEEGAAMLMEFEKTSKFDDIPEELLKNVEALQPYLDMITAE